MPRHAREVFLNIPHQITQRGSYRGRRFFLDAGDYPQYSIWLAHYTRQGRRARKRSASRLLRVKLTITAELTQSPKIVCRTLEISI